MKARECTCALNHVHLITIELLSNYTMVSFQRENRLKDFNALQLLVDKYETKIMLM